MNILELIAKRRSVRNFTEADIPQALVEKIVQAGREAPSASNRQNIRFTVLRDRSFLETLTAKVGEAIGMPGYNFHQATTMILLSAPRDSTNAFADTGCVMQNMMLAASSLGVGGYWVNQLKACSDDEPVRALLDKVAVPQDHIVTACFAMGMPAGEIFGERRHTTEVHWVE